MAGLKKRGESSTVLKMGETTTAHDYKNDMPAETWGDLSRKDKVNVFILSVLYFIQGNERIVLSPLS
jgi:hypothetical protein